MTEGKKNLQTTEGLMAEWAKAHPDEVAKRERYGELYEKLEKLRELDPEAAKQVELLVRSKSGK